MARITRIIILAIALKMLSANPSSKDYQLSRVVGGKDTVPGELKAMAAILKGNFPICGGSLFNEYCCLTAAHCFEHPKSPHLYQLVFGVHNIKKINEEFNSQTYSVNRIIIHPNYQKDDVLNDLAIACTATPVRYTEFIQPTVIPKRKLLDYCPEATVYGWGLTTENGHSSDILLKANVPKVSNRKCQEKYNQTKHVIRQSHVCFGRDDADENNACYGDSGGPLVCHTGRNNGTQIGIVSWGIGCARSAYPAVYTRVSYFYKWIQETMKNYTKNLL